MGFIRFLLFLLLVFVLARFIGRLIQEVARVFRSPESRGPAVGGSSRDEPPPKPADVKDAKFVDIPREHPANQHRDGNGS
jgi:hypothetical protein